MDGLSEQPKSIKEMFQEQWEGCTIKGLPKDWEQFRSILSRFKSDFPGGIGSNSVRDFCDMGEYKIVFNNDEASNPKRSIVFNTVIIQLLEQLIAKYPDIEILVY